MRLEQAADVLTRYIPIEIRFIDKDYSRFLLCKEERYIEIGLKTDKYEPITSLLHEIGHHLHLMNKAKTKVDRECKDAQHRFIYELQAWKYAMILSHLLNIPFDSSTAKRSIASYYVKLSRKNQIKFKRFYNTI